MQRAFRLGWRFAQLYHEPHRATAEVGSDDNELPPHLPTFSELSDGNRTELIIQEIKADLTALDATLLAGQNGSTLVSTFMDNMRSPMDSEAKKSSILLTFRSLRIRVGASDPRLSTAIDLGRVLADTVLLASSPAGYLTEFGSYRLENAYGWLEDLHTSFPEHAADAVKGSLRYWAQWVASSKGVPPDRQHDNVRRRLTLQGERWRRLLSGEILAGDLLAAEDYTKAARNYLRRTRRMAWDFVVRYAPAIAIGLLVAGGLVALCVFYAPGVSAVAGIIATGAGALGVSWKSVGATLGKVANQAEQPLWNAEVLEAVVMASFIQPVPMTDKELNALRSLAGSPKAPPELPPPAPPAIAGPAAPAQAAVT